MEQAGGERLQGHRVLLRHNQGVVEAFQGRHSVQYAREIDNAWFTACILHNMVHKVKRLDEMEEDADWVGSAGEPFTNAEVSTAMGGDGDAAAPGFEAFRARLVAHFKYVWDKKQVLLFKRASV